MSGPVRIIANVVVFNVGWLACVLSARWGQPLAAAPVVALALTGQLMLTPRGERRREALAIASVAPLGVLIDTANLAAGLWTFQDQAALSLVYIVWMLCFWTNFGAVLNVSLKWFRGRWLLAGGLAILSAPGTYYAGARLGALNIDENVWRTLIPLGVEWALIFPGALWLAGRVRQGGADRTPAPETVQ